MRGALVTGVQTCALPFSREYGCRVTGVDITPEFVAVAPGLTRLVGLADRVDHHVGSALGLPFQDGSFDGATLLHVGMNIPDKKRLCTEAQRVLRRGGVFAIYDVMRVGEGDLDFPVPWAETPETSFAVDPASYRRALDAAGFDVTAEIGRAH